MLTGVEVANLTNEVLKRRGIDKTVPAQMVYNYMKTGKIKTTLVGDKKRVEESDAFAWIKNYVEGVGTKKASTDQHLAAFDEFMGDDEVFVEGQIADDEFTEAELAELEQ